VQRLAVGNIEHFTDIDRAFAPHVDAPALVDGQVRGRSHEECRWILDRVAFAVLGKPDERRMQQVLGRIGPADRASDCTQQTQPALPVCRKLRHGVFVSSAPLFVGQPPVIRI
jgi:hypothetical protein